MLAKARAESLWRENLRKSVMGLLMVALIGEKLIIKGTSSLLGKFVSLHVPFSLSVSKHTCGSLKLTMFKCVSMCPYVCRYVNKCVCL